jgi:hypothetical protein
MTYWQVKEQQAQEELAELAQLAKGRMDAAQ